MKWGRQIVTVLAHPPLNLSGTEMTNMNPQNPLFYTSTFVNNDAAGLLPPYLTNISSLTSSMQRACFTPSGFDPLQCSLLSQAVGRSRAHQVCMGMGGSTSSPAGGVSAVVVPPTGLAAVTPIPAPVGPVTVAAALAALGSTPTSLAIC